MDTVSYMLYVCVEGGGGVCVLFTPRCPCSYHFSTSPVIQDNCCLFHMGDGSSNCLPLFIA